MTVPVRQVFISYSRSDEGPVGRISARLSNDYPVWFDQAKLIRGDLWSEKLHQALRSSSHCLVFVGPGETQPWQKDEVRSAINRAVTEADEFTLIPVLLPGAGERPDENELPPFLNNRQWVEFRESIEDEDAWHRLRSGLEGREPGFGSGSMESGKCPYKGLDVFDIDDAPFFRGRDAKTDSILSELRARIRRAGRPRFYAIIGPSGTGKSSLARAGMMAWKSRREPAAKRWRRRRFSAKPTIA